MDGDTRGPLHIFILITKDWLDTKKFSIHYYNEHTERHSLLTKIKP